MEDFTIEQIRLEALRLAQIAAEVNGVEDMIEAAKKIEEYILGKEDVEKERSK